MRNEGVVDELSGSCGVMPGRDFVSKDIGRSRFRKMIDDVTLPGGSAFGKAHSAPRSRPSPGRFRPGPPV